MKRQPSSIFNYHTNNLTSFEYLFGEELFLVASNKYVREGGEDVRVLVGVGEQAECVRGGRGQVTPGQAPASVSSGTPGILSKISLFKQTMPV